MASSSDAGRPRDRLTRRLALAASAAGAAAALFAASAAPAPAAAPPPDHDPFYAPPARLGSHAPGSILRSRRVRIPGVPAALSETAYQLLFRSTDAHGRPIAAATTLLLPADPGRGPRKLLSYQTAEDSLTTKCAPSYTLRAQGRQEATIAATKALARGWSVVIPDHEGPDSQWTVGPVEGQTTLDSLKAVERFPPAGLRSRTRIGLMGYSGGALASTWAGALQREYAPRLNVVGIAAGGIPANLIANLVRVDGSAFAGTILGVAVGVDRAYPQLRLDSLLNAAGRERARKVAADGYGCVGSVTSAPFLHVSDFSRYTAAQLASLPRMKRVFAHLNLITRPAPAAPAYYFNTIHDELTIIEPVDQLVAVNCAKGATIDYRRYPDGGHVSGSTTFTPLALAYLRDRFAGRRAPSSCPPGRHAPGRLRVHVRPRRDRRAPYRFTTTGRVTLPVGVLEGPTCRGRVTVEVRAGHRTISVRRARLNRRCRFRARVTLRRARRLHNHRRLRFIARFPGNEVLGPLRSRTVRVRVGR